MKEIVGDLWTFPHSTVCVTTNNTLKNNGHLVMGAGVALQAAIRFPDLPEILGDFVLANGNKPCYVKKFNILSFPTKWHWKDDSDIALIKQSARLVKEIADKHELKKIVLPRPGCGLGNLSWSTVKEAIREYLDDRFTVVNKD